MPCFVERRMGNSGIASFLKLGLWHLKIQMLSAFTLALHGNFSVSLHGKNFIEYYKPEVIRW